MKDKKKFLLENNKNILDNIKILLEKKGLLYELDNLLKESKETNIPLFQYIIEIKKILDYDEAVKIWSRYYKLPLKQDFTKEIEKNDIYILYEDGSVGIAFPFLYEKIKKKFPNKKIYLVSNIFFKIQDIEATGLKKEFYNIVKKAQEMNITDIHFEAKDNLLYVKYRLLGDLTTIKIYNIEIGKKLIQIIKNEASLYSDNFETEEWQLNQDGRINIEEFKLDLRLAFTPSLIYGVQNVVIRLLNKSLIRIKGKEDVNKLGYFEEDTNKLIQFLNYKTGLNIMSGATGSGKSRTFNTLLSLIPDKKKILSAEDPVEYKLDNAVQHQIKEVIKDDKKIIVDYMSYMKEFMRMDPDVIFIGEWRKMHELTEALLYAAETGHLIFTTLHASRAVNVPNLLVNQYGLKKDDIANNFNIIINQRLIKKVCPHCSKEKTFTKEDLKKFSNSKMLDIDKLKDLIGKKVKVVGDGCEKCIKLDEKDQILSKGYIDRTVIYEYIIFTPDVKNLILKTTSSYEIEKKLIELSERDEGKTFVDIVKKKLETKQIDIKEAIEGLM